MREVIVLESKDIYDTRLNHVAGIAGFAGCIEKKDLFNGHIVIASPDIPFTYVKSELVEMIGEFALLGVKVSIEYEA